MLQRVREQQKTEYDCTQFVLLILLGKWIFDEVDIVTE